MGGKYLLSGNGSERDANHSSPHSSARALCDHPRNLTDDQLKALAAQGGVAQICLYKGFINKEEDKASLSDAIRHINHIVDLIGIDHIESARILTETGTDRLLGYQRVD